MDTKSYFKNVAKSVGYAVDDLLKAKYPSTYNMKNIKKSISEANKEFREAELAARRAEMNNTFREETIPFDSELMMINLKSDLKSGKFLNKDRMKSYREGKANNAFEKEFGQSLDVMNNSFNSINKTMSQQAKLNVTIAKSQLKAQRHDILFTESMNRNRHIQNMQLTSAVNSNLVNMVEFNNNKIAPFMNQALNYYRDSMIEYRKTNALLSEMRDYYKIVNDSIINPRNANLKQTQLEQAFSGGFNIKNYTKMVRYNLKDVSKILSGAQEVVAENGESLMESPISYMIKFASSLSSWFLPNSKNKDMMINSLKTLDETMKGIPAALMLSIMNIDKSPTFNKILDSATNSKFANTMIGQILGLGNANFKSGITGALRAIFGINTNTEYNISNYNKDPMQFNGVTQKAITTVIPTLLGKIYTTIAGYEDDIIVDYNQGGRIKWASKKRKEIESQYLVNAQTAMFDFNKEMLDRINKTNLSDSEKEKIMKEFAKTNNYLAQGGSLRFNDADFAKDFANVIDPQYIPYFVSLFKSLPLSVLNSLPFNQINAKNSRSRLSRELEKESDLNGLYMATAFDKLDDDADLKEMDFNKKDGYYKFKKDNDEYIKNRGKLGNVKDSKDKILDEKIKTSNISSIQYKINLLKEIKNILIEGIIVYPMRRVPPEIINRKKNLYNIITDNERKTIENETRERDLAAKLGEKPDTEYDNLNDPEIGNIIMARIDPSKARTNPEEAVKVGTEQKGFTGYLQDLLNAPVKSTSFLINGFAKLMNRLIYGTEQDGKGLINELNDKFNEKKDKIKEWITDKANKATEYARDKWDNSSIGQYFNEKATDIKNWFSKSDAQYDEDGNIIKEGTNFAAGFQDAWNNTKNFVKTGVVEPVKQFGSDLADEFSGTIDSFKNIKTWLFGDENKEGLLYGDVLEQLKGTGFNFKKSGGKVAGMAAIGAIGGLFLGGPLLGAAIAGGSSFINASDGLKQKLFGDPKQGIEGMIPKDLVEAFPNMKKGMGIGLAGHLLLGSFLPGGPITATIVGALGGYMKTHGMLDKLFWGGERKDGSKFKGLFTKLGDFFYDHIGGYVQDFIQRQVTELQHTVNRWLIIPIKHAIKPIGVAISKTFKWVGNTLVKMMQHTVGRIGKAFGKIVGGVFSIFRWGFTKLLGGKILKNRFLKLMLPGSIISGGSNLLAKLVMTKEEYKKYKNDKNTEIEKEDADYKAKKEANEQWKKDFEDNKKNGVSWSDLHPRKSRAKKPADNKAVYDSAKVTSQAVYNTNGRLIKTIETRNDQLIDAVKKSADKIISGLKPGQNNGPKKANPKAPVRLIDKVANDINPADMTPEDKRKFYEEWKKKRYDMAAADKVAEDVAKPSRKVISLSEIEAKGLITPKPDDLAGKDVIEQQNEENAEKQASVLEKIEMNTANTSKGLLGFLKGDGKKGTSLWDTIKGIGSNLFGVLKNIGTIAMIGFGLYQFLKLYNENGGDLGEAAKDWTIDRLTSSRGFRTAKNIVNRVGKAASALKNGAKAVVNFGGKAVANVTNLFKGKNASNLTKQLASGENTVTHVVKETVIDSANTVKNKLVSKMDDAVKYLCKNKTIGKFIEPLYNGVKKAFPTIAEKVIKAAGKGMFRTLTKVLYVAEIACYINDAVTGFMDYRNTLQLPADSPQDNILAGICAIVRLLNGAVCFGVVPEKWFIEFLLSFTSRKEEVEKYQEEFKQGMEDAGFGNNVDAYNKYENPTTWSKILSGFGLADSRKEIIEDQIDRIKEEMELLDPNSAEYKEKQDQLLKLEETYSETTDTWYESLGNFFENILVKPIQKANNWLNEKVNQFWGIDKINELEETDYWSDVVLPYITDKYTIHGGADNGLIKGTSESGIDVGAIYNAYNEEVTKAIPAFASGEEKAKIYQEFFNNHADELNKLYQEAKDAGYGNEDSGGPAVRIDGTIADGIKDAGGAIDIDGKSALIDYGIKESNRRRPIDNFTCISSPYGWRDWDGDGQADEFHDGIDYAAPAGTPIYAADSGNAYVARYGYNGGWGNHIRIKHLDGTETIYGHASKLNISEGQNVTKGQKIAEVGTTGRSTGNHLHFGAYKSLASGTPKYGDGINTEDWLAGKSISVSGSNNYKNTATQDSSVNTDAQATDANATEIMDTGDDNVLNKILKELGSAFTATIMGKHYEPGDDSEGTKNTDTPFTPTNNTNPTTEYRGNIGDVKLVDFASLGSKKETFLEKIQPIAIENYLNGGVVPSLTMAQAALESGWGTSDLAKYANALFGIKAGGSWSGKTFGNGWRAYDSWDESIKDHGNLMKASRYADTRAATNGPDAARAVFRNGYTPDAGYDQQLIKMMNDYNLLSVDISARNAKGGGPLPNAGGGSIEIGSPIESYYNELNKQMNETADTLLTEKINSNRINSNNISLDNVELLLAKLVDKADVLISGVGVMGDTIAGAVTTAVATATNTNNNQIITTNNSGANIFTSRIDRDIDKNSNAMRNYVNTLAKGN